MRSRKERSHRGAPADDDDLSAIEPSLRCGVYVDGKPKPRYRGVLHACVAVALLVALLALLLALTTAARADGASSSLVLRCSYRTVTRGAIGRRDPHVNMLELARGVIERRDPHTKITRGRRIGR